MVGFFTFVSQNVFAQSNAGVVEPELASPSATLLELAPPAVNPINLTLSPVTLSLQTDPGEQAHSSIRVFNNNIETEYLTIELAKFTADESGDRPKINKFEPTDTEQKWMSFSEPNFSVNPGEWKTIDVNFSPPESAALSYYYAILIKRQNTSTTQDVNTVVTGAPAILVLTTVNSPSAIQELQLDDFSVKDFVVEYLPANFSINIRNTGNVHIRPIGNIFIDSMKGKDVGIIAVNKDSGLILPNTVRTFNTFWEDGFPAYKPIIENGVVQKDEKGETKYALDWDLANIKNFRFGKYTANLLLVYDNGQRDVPIESVLTFWVIPWKILLVFAVILTTMIAGIGFPLIFLIKKLKRKKKIETTEINEDQN